MKPSEPSKFYVFATKDNITAIRFERDVQHARETAVAMTEWAGNVQAVKVKVAA